MPSRAFQKFECNLLVDVDRIIESHASLNHDGGGRRGLGHLTRSGVFMLCAAWELYVEEVGREIAGYLTDRAISPGDLPLAAQKALSQHVKGSKHELKPLELAGVGWEAVYLTCVEEALGGLNTPKSDPIDQLYQKFIGWPDCSSCWSCGGNAINEFVKARGDIAHRGRDTRYVKIGDLRAHRVTIVDTVLEHDNAAADFVRDNSRGGSPWRRRATP